MIVDTEVTTRVLSVAPELAHRAPALNAPQTIRLAPTQPCPALAAGQDYRIILPENEPYQRGYWPIGGRNVITVGGEIQVAATGQAREDRAVYTKGATGTVYLEGLKISGQNTKDALVVDNRFGGTVIVQNLAVPDGVHGTQAGYHADVFQSWAGPGRVLMDHVYAKTFYQGVFIVPDDQWNSGSLIWDGNTSVDLRHVHIDSTEAAGYSLWAAPRYLTEFPVPVFCHDVYADPNPARATKDWVCWPKTDPKWAPVILGKPEVPMVDVNAVGIGYRSQWAELNTLGL